MLRKSKVLVKASKRLCKAKFSRDNKEKADRHTFVQRQLASTVQNTGFLLENIGEDNFVRKHDVTYNVVRSLAGMQNGFSQDKSFVKEATKIHQSSQMARLPLFSLSNNPATNPIRTKIQSGSSSRHLFDQSGVGILMEHPEVFKLMQPPTQGGNFQTRPDHGHDIQSGLLGPRSDTPAPVIAQALSTRSDAAERMTQQQVPSPTSRMTNVDSSDLIFGRQDGSSGNITRPINSSQGRNVLPTAGRVPTPPPTLINSRRSSGLFLRCRRNQIPFYIWNPIPYYEAEDIRDEYMYGLGPLYHREGALPSANRQGDEETSLQQHIARIQEIRMCKMCFNKAAVAWLTPCLHKVCMECANVLTNCPVCKSKTKTAVKFFE